MQTGKYNSQRAPRDRQRLLEAYRQVVASVREARSLQTVMEKERQLRRLMHYLQRAGQQ